MPRASSSRSGQARNFQAYARQFSEASTAALGGDLGWVRAAQLPPELAALVIQMPVGAISDPVEIPGGYSIILLVDNRQVLVADPRDAVLSLMQLSVSIPAGTTEAQATARANQLAQASQSMGGCGTRPKSRARSARRSSTTTRSSVRELPAPLQQMLLNLNVGQATPPFGSAERISVLVLCGRDDPSADEHADRRNDSRSS